MTPYRKGGYPGYYSRLTHGARSRVVGLGTASVHTAQLIEGWVAQLRADRRFDVIDGVLDRTFTLPDAYDHRHALDEWIRAQTEVDLDPLVDEWDGRGKRARSAVYVRQVRALIPKGQRFPITRFRRREIASFLEQLGCADPTRNRYKAALSQFAQWLIRHELIDANPVRDAGTFSEHVPRTEHLSPADAQRLVAALDGEVRVAAALMANGLEWSAVAPLRRADIDLEARTIEAKGLKTRFRRRTIEITEAWTFPTIEACCKTLLPAAHVVTISERQALDAQTAACVRLELPRQRLHDWRHTYAITALRRGDDHQRIKRQLGHSPHSTLLYKVYGVYIAEFATNSATSAKTRREVRRAK